LSKSRTKSARRPTTRKPATRKPVSKAAVRIPRVAKGKKPQYFSDPATDKLLWMTLSLMEELSVTRDRLDSVERLLAARKLLKKHEVDCYVPAPAAAAERTQRRSAYVDRLLRGVHAEIEQLGGSGDADRDEHIEAVES